MNYQNFLKIIRKGQLGKSRGLSFGLPRFSKLIPDLQKGMYYLVGGESGAGKTSFVDDRLVSAPFEDSLIKKQKIKGIYYSFEVDTLSKVSKLASRKLFMEEGIIVTSPDILGHNENILPEHNFQRISKYETYFNEMFETLTFYDYAKSPTDIEKDLYAFSETIGKWKGEDFIENDIDCTYLVVIDHIGLIKRLGMSKKEAMDYLSSILIHFRNKCKMTFIVIAQFNRNLSSSDRFNINRVIPQMSDFADTSNLIQDCDKAFGIFSPAKYGFTDYLGYTIDPLADNFRSLHILKNRQGVSDRMVPLEFLGGVGYFREYTK